MNNTTQDSDAFTPRHCCNQGENKYLVRLGMSFEVKLSAKTVRVDGAVEEFVGCTGTLGDWSVSPP